jgi:hypothetical protein
MTFYVISEKGTLIARSTIRSAVSTDDPNLRLLDPALVRPLADEDDDNLLESMAESILKLSNLPTFDPLEVVGRILPFRDAGVRKQATVTAYDPDSEQFAVAFKRGGADLVNRATVLEAMVADASADDGTSFGPSNRWWATAQAETKRRFKSRGKAVRRHGWRSAQCARPTHLPWSCMRRITT